VLLIASFNDTFHLIHSQYSYSSTVANADSTLTFEQLFSTVTDRNKNGVSADMYAGVRIFIGIPYHKR